MTEKNACLMLVMLLIIATLAPFINTTQLAAGQQIIIVDQGGNGDYLTIQEGVAAANHGDIVRVWAGEYRENVHVYREISLVGNGSDETIIDGEGDYYGIRLSADGSEITGFTITNSSYGVSIEYAENIIIHNNSIVYNINGGVDVGGILSGIVITNNFISYNGGSGLILEGPYENVIANNTITHHTFSSIYIWGIHYEAYNNVIVNNTISHNGNGTKINPWVKFHHNIIMDNTVTDNNYYGIDIQGSSSMGEIQHNNTVSNNIVSGNKYGIRIYDSVDTMIDNNTVTYNEYGISVENIKNIFEPEDVHRNSIVNNTVMYNDIGISLVLDTKGNTIYHNRLINNTVQAKTPFVEETDDELLNRWNLSYPHGGNYWSDHTGPDRFKGTEQDIPGADGVVDEPRHIQNNVFDHYPWANQDFIMPTVDYIRIVDTEDSGEVTFEDTEVYVSETVTGYAAGFNESAGYVGDVDAGWSVVNEDGAQAYTLPTIGTSSMFYTGDTTGRALWTAEYDGVTYTAVFDILPKVDHIRIVDTEGSGEYVIRDAYLPIGRSLTGYAALFNSTHGYIGNVDAGWSVVNEDGAQAFTTPTNGTSSTFDPGNTTGRAIWTAEYDGVTYTVVFDIIPKVDYIRIVDTEGTGMNGITALYLPARDSLRGYAAAFNHTAGYIGDVNVTWSVTNEEGARAYTSPGRGTSSTLNAGHFTGQGTWTAEYADGIYHTAEFTVLPGIDHIRIVDTASTGESEITGGMAAGNRTIRGYAAGFNDTAGYVCDVNVTWSVTNSGGAETVINPVNGTSSTLYTGLEEGSVIWTADYGSGITHSVTFVIDINPPEVTIISPGDGSELTVGDIVVEWEGSDDISGISHYEIRLNDGDWIDVGGATVYTLTITAPGVHSITVRAYDGAGNTAVDNTEVTVRESFVGSYWWLFLIAAIVLVTAYVLLKRRPTEDESEEEPTETTKEEE